MSSYSDSIHWSKAPGLEGFHTPHETGETYPPPTKHRMGKCVHEWFEEQVEKSPDAVAVVYGSRSLSYRQLNARANQLARHLRSMGVGPDEPVGLCIERSLEMAVVVLAILKAGGAYVPLDPSYPKERLAYMIENNGSTHLITQASQLEILPTGITGAFCLENLPAGLAEENLPLNTSPENLAYILYTSGSTGQPKGVAMEHGPLVNLVNWQFQQSGAAMRTLQFASLNFDVSFQELFTTWLAGGTLMLIDPQTRMNPSALWEFIAESKLERLYLPVVMLRYLVEAAKRSTQTAPTLREIITAGEQLRITPSIRAFFTARPGLTLHNHYGPTESHVVTAWTLTGSPETWPELPPIGFPIANVSIHLLDEQMNPVPAGEPGELYIGGKALARGYWNQPEKTAERFIPDPFSPQVGARLYQSGDVARLLPDGGIECMGRADHQVKIRGFRIEPGEIETLLETHPDLEACSVVAQEDSMGSKILVAFLVIKSGSQLSLDSLRGWVGSKLPDYMVPSRFATLDALPLSPTGKVDRKTLEKTRGTTLTSGTEHVPARNDLESRLVEIWESLLGHERIGVLDNFFELGGNSLRAAQLTAEITKITGKRLHIATLFHSPTIESLARRLSENDWVPQWKQLVQLQPHGSKPPLFFVHGWGGDVFFFVDLAMQMAPDQPVYGIQSANQSGDDPGHDSVESLAASYVKELRAFQPEGPYHLSGYSLGGIIAFEIARQLRSQGQEVALLALLDSSPIGGVSRGIYARTMMRHLLTRTGFHFRHWWKMPAGDRLEYLQKRMSSLRSYMTGNKTKRVVTAEPPADGGQAEDDLASLDPFYSLTQSYRVQRYDGFIDIFVSDDAKPHKILSWRYAARGGIQYHAVPGNHYQILEPGHVEHLAVLMKAALNRSQDKPAGVVGINGSAKQLIGLNAFIEIARIGSDI